MLILGVDPSLTATGLVLLDTGVTPGPRVLLHSTVRPRSKGQSLATRLVELDRRVRDFLYDEVQYRTGSEIEAACEDPTDWKPHGGLQGRVETTRIAKLGAAFGVAYLALAHTMPTTVYPTREWLPWKRNRRGGVHFLAHADVKRLMLMAHPVLEGLTDDELMAAGVALHHATITRLTAAAGRDA